MPESADEVHARVTAAAGPDGRLPAPPIAGWDIFPWDAVDGAVVPRVLRAPEPEAPREGEEGGGPCPMCAGFSPERIVWEDELWVLTCFPESSGMPLVLTLWAREHLDIGSFGDEEAAGLGRIANRLVRIMEGMPGIGRVHVNRWGDGCSHAHIWFFARPEGLPDIRGSFAVEWDAILPPVPDSIRRADLHTVATKLANWGGTARA
jgi:hypothetical protein